MKWEKKKTIYVSHNDKSGLISTYAENLIDAVKNKNSKSNQGTKHYFSLSERCKGISAIDIVDYVIIYTLIANV